MEKLLIGTYQSESGKIFTDIIIDYHLFGNLNNSNKTILINHALTGNSQLTGENGWWNEIVAKNAVIDINDYNIIIFNFLGNSSSEDNICREEFFNLTLSDIAKIFILALEKLNIHRLYANIGVSIGAMLSWQIAMLKPKFSELLIPIAGHTESTDWIIAFNYIQKRVFEESDSSIEIARMIAMLSYRGSESFSQKFQKSYNKNRKIYEVESYLKYQGEKLRKRFNSDSYQLMLHYMNEAHITRDLENIESKIIQINIQSDLLYPPNLNEETKKYLDKKGVKSELYTIQSVHGHDSFLIEFEQMKNIFKKCFKKRNILVKTEAS